MFLFISYGWVLLITAYAAWTDIHTRTISNKLVSAGFMGLLLWQLIHLNFHWESFFIGTFVGLALWKLKFIGGGDSKLLILITTAFIPSQIMLLYAFITTAGALQALYYLKYKPQKTLPYAVAILVGTILCITFWIFTDGYQNIFRHGQRTFV